ncbi:MAG: beta strand repeat-containing protein, partial [Actinomycetota bacterium]
NDRGFGEANARAAIELAISRYGTPSALSVNHGGPYTAIQGQTRILTAVPTGGQPTYAAAWDLDDDGTFETPGTSVAFTNTGSTGTRTVRVRVTDSAPTPATVIATTTVTVVPAVSVFSDNVEGGTNGWVTAGAPEGAGWHQTTVRASSATHSWYPGNDLTQVYAPRQNLTLTRQINLSTGPGASSGQLVLRFARSGSLEPTFDFLNARIREVGSPTTETLESWDNYDGGNLWTTHAYDITPYRGRNIEVEFQFTTDDFNDLPFVDATGPFVDDIAIIGTPPSGIDTIPPGAVTTLGAGAAGPTTIPLGWQATGDDGSAGTATSYDLRYSTSPITAGNFTLATAVFGLPAPAPSGQLQTFTVPGLAPNTPHYFAIKAIDEAPNVGPISNVIRAVTLGPPPPAIPGWLEAGGSGTRAGHAGGRGSLAVPNILATLTLDAAPIDASPLIADLNGDGKLDVLAIQDATAQTPTRVRAFRQVTSGLQPLWTYSVPALAGQTEGVGNLAVGQLNGTGPLEVAVYSNNIINAQGVTSNQGRLAVLNAATGALIDDLSVDTANPEALVIGVDGPPAIGDVNGDGINEIVLIHHVGGTTPGSFMTGITLTGTTLIERFDTNLTSASNWRSWALAELSAAHDGREIVAGQNATFVNSASTGAVRVCTPNAGDAVCGQNIATTTGIEGVSVADLDGDGQPEIVANGRTGESLNVIKTFPALSRVSLTDGFHWNTASLADVDADGKADIVNVANSGNSTFPEHDPLRNGHVTLRGFNGTAIVDKGTLNRTAGPGQNLHSKGGTLVDIRGDSKPEFVFGSGDGNIVALSFNSPPAPLWSLPAGGTPRSQIAAGDVTGDGLLDLVAGTAEGSLLIIGAGPPASLTLDPASSTIGAGGAQAYTANGTDAAGNPLGDVTAGTTFSIAGGGSCTANSCTSTVAGAHTVTGTNGAATGTATLNVTPGPLAGIEVTPSTATIPAGGTQTYTATAFDTYGNTIGDVTASTVFSIGPNGSCAANVCGATIAGLHTVDGVHAGETDGASLTVTPGPAASLTLSPSSSTIVAGASQAYTATAEDEFGNSLGDVTATTVFSIGPNGSCTGASCTATVAGGHTVTGTNGAANGTASLSVVPGPVASITLTPPASTITAGASQTYTVNGFDSYGNPIGDVTPTTTFSIAPNGSCAGNACSATVAGPHTVTATNGPANATASLTVNAGPPATLVLAPATATITAGGSQTYT